MPCPDENSLARFVDGTLAPEQRVALDSHLTECDECRPLVSALAAGLGRTMPPPPEPSLPPPPDDAEEDDGPPHFTDGTVVAGRYRVVRFAGRGGMGEVYEVEDQELGTRVALKMIRPEIALQRRVVERFKREVYFARKVTHPNVCRLFDVGYHDGPPRVTFCTMELLDGLTLADRIHHLGRMEPAQALPLVEQIAAGLRAAHDAGVVHRDLKSGNVILVPGPGGERAVITDFGLARGVEPGQDTAIATTTHGGVVGSPVYMAPEQIAGEEVHFAADLYAFGVVLYEMVTGTWPFWGGSAALTAIKRLQEPAPSPRVHVPDLDPRWEAAILRALQRWPADRFASVSELVAALSGPAPREPRDRSGEVVGGYVLRTPLRERAASTRYLADHVQLPRQAAVDLISSQVPEARVTSFFAELTTLSQLRHEHLPEVLDCGRLADGTSYVLNPFSPGRTLAERLRDEEQLTMKQALPILRSLASALDAAHAADICHGAIDPSHVLLVPSASGGERVVLDGFGVHALTRPEGATATPDDDRKALATLAAAMLVGEANDPQDDVIRRALAPERVATYPTAAALVVALAAPPPPDEAEHVMSTAHLPGLRRRDETEVDPPREAPAPRRAVGPWIVGAIASAAVGSLLVVLTQRTPATLPPITSPAVSTPAASTPAASAPAASTPGPTATPHVTLTVHVDPPNATLRLDGALSSPVIDHPRDDRAHVLELSAPGHRPERHAVSFAHDAALTLKLEKLERKPRPKSGLITDYP